jgi:hypothetical protein
MLGAMLAIGSRSRLRFLPASLSWPCGFARRNASDCRRLLGRHQVPAIVSPPSDRVRKVTSRNILEAYEFKRFAATKKISGGSLL